MQSTAGNCAAVELNAAILTRKVDAPMLFALITTGIPKAPPARPSPADHGIICIRKGSGPGIGAVAGPAQSSRREARSAKPLMLDSASRLIPLLMMGLLMVGEVNVLFVNVSVVVRPPAYHLRSGVPVYCRHLQPGPEKRLPEVAPVNPTTAPGPFKNRCPLELLN